jgi:hypothetical protein
MNFTANRPLDIPKGCLRILEIANAISHAAIT